VVGGSSWNSHTTDSWDNQPIAPDYTNHNSGYNNQGFHGGGIQQQASEETWDDDWDDDNEDNSSNSTTNTSQVTVTVNQKGLGCMRVYRKLVMVYCLFIKAVQRYH
jgi:hypothetical protein